MYGGIALEKDSEAIAEVGGEVVGIGVFGGKLDEVGCGLFEGVGEFAGEEATVVEMRIGEGPIGLRIPGGIDDGPNI